MMKKTIHATGGWYPPLSGALQERTTRLRAFLTLCLQRLARGRVRERLLELGLRLLGDVRVLQCRDRAGDRRLEGGEVGRKPGELLQELTGRRIGGLLGIVLEGLEARFELLGRRVQLLL